MLEALQSAGDQFGVNAGLLDLGQLRLRRHLADTAEGKGASRLHTHTHTHTHTHMHTHTYTHTHIHTYTHKQTEKRAYCCLEKEIQTPMARGWSTTSIRNALSSLTLIVSGSIAD